MQLLITVRNRSSDHYAKLSRLVNLQIDVPEKGTVNDVAEILSKRVKVPPQSFRIILCGKVLGGATPLKSLLLGPQTLVLNDDSL
ncbi:unnamed protein product [Anisakis simplex]|uniref:Ubiquitin-like domain-containing protein n=1 Tax=Anisakis simplex TaxID=6269 RepID=A0A0M3KCF6_ANISI|nr:unnamed protein product [Anisakis simplex]